MTREHRLNGVLLTNRIEVVPDSSGSMGLATAAEFGVFATGRVLIDDPNGDLDLKAWQPFTVDETACTPSRIWTGVIRERKVGRLGRVFTDTGRAHDCVLLDVNERLHRKIVRMNAGKRPSENDLARLTYLLGSEAMAGLVSDLGLVTSTPAGTLLEEDLRDKYPDNIIESFARVSGKDFFTYYDQGVDDFGLFYYADDASVWPASISISNVKSEITAGAGGTVFGPDDDASGEWQPDDIYTAVQFIYKGAKIYVQSAATAAAYGIDRDAVYSTDAVGRLATAQQVAKDWLNVRSGEKRVVTVLLTLPANKVNHAFAGQEIDVKLTDLPGFEAGVTTRIRRRTVRPISTDVYEVELDLWAPPAPVDDAAGADCVATINRSGATSDAIDAGKHVFPFTPTAGTLLMFVWTKRDGGAMAEDTGWTKGASSYEPTYPIGFDDSLAVAWKQSDGTETEYDTGNVGLNQTGRLYEILCGTAGEVTDSRIDQTSMINDCHTAFDQLADDTTTTGGALIFGLLVNGYDVGGSCPTGGFAPVSPWAIDFQDGSLFHPQRGFVTQTVTAAGTYTPEATFVASLTGTGYHGITITIPFTGSEVPLPVLGDAISETPTGAIDASNKDFAAAGGWIVGSLRVFHDGFDQTPHVINEDAVAGTFSLDYAPSVGSLITVYYESR